MKTNLTIKEILGTLIYFIAIVFIAILIVLVIFNLIHAKEYVTNQITTCEDRDGDLIQGPVCYKKISCSTAVKWLNQEGCEEFVGK